MERSTSPAIAKVSRLRKSEDMSTKTFVAIDFETADYGRDSACAIGLVRVEDGRVVHRESHLIRPPRPDFMFTHIHGITWSMVAREPTFHDLWPKIKAVLAGVDFMAAHNASFDRSVLTSCCAVARLRPPGVPFVCTMRLARKAWNLRPTTLPHVCRYLEVRLRHHDALSDAEACAKIVLASRSEPACEHLIGKVLARPGDGRQELRKRVKRNDE